MKLLSDIELANTRRKLGELEALYRDHEGDIGGGRGTARNVDGVLDALD